MLFSTSYFPPIPYFQALVRHTNITIDGNEYYEKQTWRNRMAILTGNGALNLSIPVNRPHGSKSPVGTLTLDHSTDWRKDHWKAIESAYQHAPYFFYYGEQVKELIYSNEPFLIDYNTNILKQFLNWLDFEQLTITYSEDFQELPKAKDYRYIYNQKKFNFEQAPYIQVFSDKFPFMANLSILDLIMNEGPIARNYLTRDNPHLDR